MVQCPISAGTFNIFSSFFFLLFLFIQTNAFASQQISQLDNKDGTGSKSTLIY